MSERPRSGNVIILKIKPTGRYCEPLGFRFPAIFRVTGFCWQATADNEMVMVDGELVPDETKPVTLYSLSNDPNDLPMQIAKPAFTLISHLDPTVDDGWLIIRHHRSKDIADGYIAGMIDTDDSEWTDTANVYQTEAGVFTLLYRMPRVGADNHLIAFYAEVGRFEDWFGVVLPDGSWLPQTEQPMYAAD